MKFRECTFLVAILVVAATASTPQQEKAQNNPADSQTGLELWWAGSFILSDTDFPLTVKPEYLNYPIGDQAAKGGGYSGKFTNSFGIGARVTPLVSFGLFGLFPAYEAKDIAGSEDITRSSWSAGLTTRFYPLVFINEINPYIDLSVAFGAGYLSDKQEYKTDEFVWDAKISMETHSVIFPIQIGIGYRLHERVSVGARLDYFLIAPVEGCMDVDIGDPVLYGDGIYLVGGKYCKSGNYAHMLNLADNSILTIGGEVRATLF